MHLDAAQVPRTGCDPSKESQIHVTQAPAPAASHKLFFVWFMFRGGTADHAGHMWLYITVPVQLHIWHKCRTSCQNMKKSLLTKYL